MGEVLPLAALLAMVIAMWLPFGFKTPGLLEEWYLGGLASTGYPLWFVDQSPMLREHALRPLTFVPFIASYTLTPGSFLGFNLIYMGLVTLKGVSTYLLIRRLLNGHRLFALAVAALFVVYPADTGLLALRAINIQGAVALYLTAAYLLLRYWDTRSRSTLLLMWGTLAASLLMYELAYPMVALTPVLLIWRERRITRRVIGTSLLWYIVPLFTGLYMVANMIALRGALRQTALFNVTTDGSASPLHEILNAIAQLFSRSLFIGWRDAVPTVPVEIFLTLFLLLFLAFFASWRFKASQSSVLSPQSVLTLLLSGLAIIFIGFSPYLIYATHRFETLRTYYLAAFGGALCVMTVLYLLSRGHRILFTVLMFFPLVAGISNALAQRGRDVTLSLRQQRFLGELMAQVPQAADDTALVIVDHTGMMHDTLFFGVELTFPQTVRYLYQGQPVHGIICYSPGIQAGGCAFESDGFHHKSNTLKPFFAPYDRLIVFDYTYEAGLVMRPQLDHSGYQPYSRITADESPLFSTLFTCWPVEACTIAIDELLPQGGRIDFGFNALHGMGWYNLGRRPDGVDFRWSASNHTDLALRLDETINYDISFRVLDIFPPNTPGALRLDLNGTPINLTWITDHQGWLYRGRIPGRAANLAVDRLNFMFDHIGRHPEFHNPLGIAVDWLALEPATSADSAVLEFDGTTSGIGWRAQETAPDGTTFQWSIARAAVVDIGWLVPADYAVEIKPFAILDPNTYADLQVTVDGKALHLTLTPQGTLRADLPRELVERAGANIQLTLTLPHLTVIENQKLGIAIDWVHVNRAE